MTLRERNARLDAAAAALRGHMIPLAAFFTSLGRSGAIVAVALFSWIVALASHHGLPQLGALFAAQIVVQGAVAVCKRRVRRVRPSNALRRPEVDFSYPSGHAATAVVFYGGLLAIVRQEALATPGTALATVALGFCCVGIPWSRLALGAHFCTDVLGGLAFGAAGLCALAALGWPYASAW